MGLINWKKIFQPDWEKVKKQTEEKKKKLEESAKQVGSFINTVISKTKEVGTNIVKQNVKDTELLGSTFIDKPIKKIAETTKNVYNVVKTPEFKKQLKEVPSVAKESFEVGVPQTMSALGRSEIEILESLNVLPGYRKKLEESYNFYKSVTAKQMQDLPKDIGSFEDPRFYAQGVAQSIPNMLGALAVGTSTALATGGNPFAGTAAAFAFTSMLEGGTAHEEAIASGAKEEQADKAALFVGTLNGVLELLPIWKYIGKTPQGKMITKDFVRTLTKTALKQGLEEGVTETLQEAVSNTARTWYDKNAKIINKNLLESGAIGALSGVLMGGGANVVGLNASEVPIGLTTKDVNQRANLLREQANQAYEKGDLEQHHKLGEELVKETGAKSQQEFKIGDTVKDIWTDETKVVTDKSNADPKTEVSTKWVEDKRWVAVSSQEGLGLETMPTKIAENVVPTQPELPVIQPQENVGGMTPISNVLESFRPETIGRTIKSPELVQEEVAKINEGTTGIKLSSEETKIKFSEAEAAKVLGKVPETRDLKAFNKVYEWMTRPVVQSHPEATIPQAIASRILSRGVEPVMKVFDKIGTGPQNRKTITAFWEETAKLPVKHSYMDIVLSHPSPSEMENARVPLDLTEKTISPLKPVLPDATKVLPKPEGIKTIGARLDAIKTFKTYYDARIQKLENFMLVNNINNENLIRTREGSMDYVSPVMQQTDKMLKDLLDELFNYLDIDPRYRKNYFPRIQYKDGGQLLTIINKYTEVPFAKVMNLIHGNRLRRQTKKLFDPSIWSSDLPEVLRDYTERTAVYHYTYDTDYINKALDYIKNGETDKINIIDHLHEVGDKEAKIAKETAREDLESLRTSREGASEETRAVIDEDIKSIEDTYDSIGERTIFNPEFNVQDRHRALLNPSLLLEKIGLLDLWRPLRDYKATAINLIKEWQPIIESGNQVQFIKEISKALGLEGQQRIDFYNDALRTIYKASEKGQDKLETMTKIAYNVAQHQTHSQALLNVEKWIKTHDIPNNALRAFLEDQFKRVSFAEIETKNLGENILSAARKLMSRRYIGAKPRTAIRNVFEIGRVVAEYDVPTFLRAEKAALSSKASENYSNKYAVNAEDSFRKGILNAVPKDVNIKTVGQLYDKVMNTLDFKLNYKMFMIFEIHKNNVFLAAAEDYGRNKLGLTDMDLQNYVLDQFNKLAIVPTAFTTPGVFQNEIIKTGFLFQQYNLQDWGITYEKGKQALTGDKKAMAYLAKILAWKTGQFIIEKALWGGDIMSVLGGKLGAGPIIALIGLMCSLLMDYFNNYDEEGYSFSDFLSDKAQTEIKALGYSLIGLPGGLITQIEEGSQAQKEGGVFSPSGRLKFPNEVSTLRNIMAMMFGVYTTPTAQWVRTRDTGDLFSFLGMGQTELPLGEADTKIYKTMAEGGAGKTELRGIYLRMLKMRAMRSYSSQLGNIAKEQVSGKITVQEGTKRRMRAKMIMEKEINRLDKINEKGFESLPF
jgi:hypothetical protein